MTGELRLIDTNVLVHAYTMSDERKHGAALSLVEKVWKRVSPVCRQAGRIGCHGDFQSPVRDRVRELKNRMAGKKTGTGWFPGAAG